MKHSKMDITTFSIQNTTGRVITIIHEPECFEFELETNEEIQIETECSHDSVLLRISNYEGNAILSILDGNSLYKVKYKGHDVFAKFFES